MKKTEGGQTILYINQYYEKNLTTGVVTTSYYLGGQLIAQRAGTTLTYIHQDNLGSTSVMSTSTGTLDSAMTLYPFGAARTGDVNTAKKFTGQRLDGTGLYYYNARYYDPLIGRFISPDNVGQNLNDPQSLNRYTYCSNNPLKYTDPTGHFSINWKTVLKVAVAVVVVAVVVAAVIIAAPVVLTAISTAACIASASTSIAAVSTAAMSVAVATSAAAVAMLPVAATVAAIPVLGWAGTIVAGAGLTYIGLGPPGGPISYTIESGELVNRVYDVRGTVPSNGYSTMYGGSYCPGDLDPGSASKLIETRGLGSYNGADMGVVFQASQDIPAVWQTATGGTSPEILIDECYRKYLEVYKTFINNP